MLRSNFRYAWRSLWRSKVFFLVAVLTLAVGIGANTALFSVVYAVLLHSLPFRDAGRVYEVNRFYRQGALSSSSQAGTEQWQSIPDIEDIEAQAHSFSGMAATQFAGVMTVTSSGRPVPRAVLAVRVTPIFFSVLGFEPIIGRGFTPAEAERQYPVVVLTHRFWMSQFAGDPAVIGHTLELNHLGYRIVGVLPPHLLVIDLDVRVLLPLSFDAVPPLLRVRRTYGVLGMLFAEN
jgi:hypothetical protein